MKSDLILYNMVFILLFSLPAPVALSKNKTFMETPIGSTPNPSRMEIQSLFTRLWGKKQMRILMGKLSTFAWKYANKKEI